MELSFFRAACMGLWFRSATKTMLPTEPCFCCGWAVCRASRPSLLLTLPSQWVELGVRRVGRGHNWAGDPSWPERYSMPCNIMLSNEEGEEGELREAAIFCSGTGWVSIYPWEVASGCLCVTCVALCSSHSTSSPIKHFLSQPSSFLAFILLFLLLGPTSWGGSECLLGLTHNRCLSRNLYTT